MNYYLKKLRDKIKLKEILKKKKIKDIFKDIYIKNFWSDKETKSGPGSNKESTFYIKKKLHYIIKKYKIKSIVDAPCGEFSWIESVINNHNLKYTGIDIVNKITLFNKKKSNKKINFKTKNIIEDKIPEVDLLICRDCWTHFSYKDIVDCLKNFKKAPVKYLLITGFENKNILNRDIDTGDFRIINLFEKPFDFYKNYLLKIKDAKSSKNLGKYMYLYKKKQFFRNFKHSFI